MLLKRSAAAMLVLGPGLLIASMLVPPTRGGLWTEVQQQALSSAEIEAHNLTIALDKAKRGSREREELERQKNAAEGSLKLKNAELQDARAARHRNSRIVFWCGVSASVAGLVLYGISKSS